MLDFIGIGLGPFNLSLASLLKDKSELEYLFFEKKAQFDWHAGMQLPDTVLQVPFMADLVSMIDPTSPFSFLNYLKQHQRLYKFYFLERPHIPRVEYNHYCQWVAHQIDQIQYLSTVTAIYPKEIGFEVVVHQAGVNNRYQCKNLVIGSGNVPYLPESLENIQKKYPERCVHSADYLHQKLDHLQGNVVVLGSGQSAAEVFQDLLDRQYKNDQSNQVQPNVQPKFQLHWLTRASGFFPMEYSPLGLEHFSPDYLACFYALDETTKQQQLAQQSLLYKGISAQTIAEIYQRLYHRSIAQKNPVTHLHAQANLIEVVETSDQKLGLIFEHKLNQQKFYLKADLVVAATGYRTPELSFMNHLKALLATDSHGRWIISKDYRLEYSGAGNIFVQNQEMHSHGVLTPDLGMGAYRAANIANQLLGQMYYQIVEQQQCFQYFDPDKNPEIQMLDQYSASAEMNFDAEKNTGQATVQSINFSDAKQSSVLKQNTRPSQTVQHVKYEKSI